MKRMLNALFCGLLFLSGLAPTSLSASQVYSNDALSMTVTVESRHVSYFEACVPVREDEPFQIIWGSETVKGSVSGTVSIPDRGVFPTTLKISEGNGQCQTETTRKLSLDKPEEWSNVVSAAFNHIDTYRFVLSRKQCRAEDSRDSISDAGVGLITGFAYFAWDN